MIQSLVLALVALLVLGCDISVIKDQDAGSDAGADASSTDGATSCDKSNDCTQCAACAAHGICSGLVTACKNNSACVAIDECYTLCGADASCREQCLLMNTEGVTTYDAVSRCMYCQVCPTDCYKQRACN